MPLDAHVQLLYAATLDRLAAPIPTAPLHRALQRLHAEHDAWAARQRAAAEEEAAARAEAARELAQQDGHLHALFLGQLGHEGEAEADAAEADATFAAIAAALPGTKAGAGADEEMAPPLTLRPHDDAGAAAGASGAVASGNPPTVAGPVPTPLLAETMAPASADGVPGLSPAAGSSNMLASLAPAAAAAAAIAAHGSSSQLAALGPTGHAAAHGTANKSPKDAPEAAPAQAGAPLPAGAHAPAPAAGAAAAAGPAAGGAPQLPAAAAACGEAAADPAGELDLESLMLEFVEHPQGSPSAKHHVIPLLALPASEAQPRLGQQQPSPQQGPLPGEAAAGQRSQLPPERQQEARAQQGEPQGLAAAQQQQQPQQAGAWQPASLPASSAHVAEAAGQPAASNGPQAQPAAAQKGSATAAAASQRAGSAAAPAAQQAATQAGAAAQPKPSQPAVPAAEQAPGAKAAVIASQGGGPAVAAPVHAAAAADAPAAGGEQAVAQAATLSGGAPQPPVQLPSAEQVERLRQHTPELGAAALLLLFCLHAAHPSLPDPGLASAAQTAAGLVAVPAVAGQERDGATEGGQAAAAARLDDSPASAAGAAASQPDHDHEAAEGWHADGAAPDGSQAPASGLAGGGPAPAASEQVDRGGGVGNPQGLATAEEPNPARGLEAMGGGGRVKIYLGREHQQALLGEAPHQQAGCRAPAGLPARPLACVGAATCLCRLALDCPNAVSALPLICLKPCRSTCPPLPRRTPPPLQAWRRACRPLAQRLWRPCASCAHPGRLCWAGRAAWRRRPRRRPMSWSG